MLAADAIANHLRRYRFSYSSERELQDGIARALDAGGFVWHREVRLSAIDVVDFLVDTVAVEVKVSGSPIEIARQLSRYADSPGVAELLLVTRKSQHALRLPDSLAGKPLVVLSLEGSAL
jgi:hypothetical protein